MSFSPPPWRWDIGDAGCFALFDAEGGEVVSAARDGFDVFIPNEADRALIAAAPKMYEELCRLVAGHVDNCGACCLRARIDGNEEDAETP